MFNIILYNIITEGFLLKLYFIFFGGIFLKLNTKKLTLIAVIAALYTALTFLFANVSYGPIQFRVSEFLSVLALFSFIPVFGLTLGCFTSNLIGLLLGAEGASIPDLFIGTFATFIAATICYYIGKNRKIVLMYIFGMLPLVLVNGLIIGFELTFISRLGEGFLFNFATVAFGEFLVCYGLGLPFLYVLLRNKLYKKLF